ncbi:CU044_5270 family protein [Saccharothrix deserti]|uniref:CU044_5270 family protein n=1 Tax=Saccharothrix deserti TaxID=2593674 RepID=UPI00131ABA4E|nr:CU044_5270 family protein [Saccharothrix deserti]
MSDDNIRRVWTEDELDAALEAVNADVRTDEQVLARARAALMITTEQGETQVTTTQEPEVATAVEPRPRRSARRWVAAAAAVGVLVAGALIAQTLPFRGKAPATAEAVATLDRAAAQAIGAVDEPVGPGQYRYIATHAWWMATHDMGDEKFALLAENLMETWAPANEQDEWMLRRDVTGNRQWVIGTEEEAKAAGAETEGGWPEGEWRAKCGDFYSDVKCQNEGSWQIPTAAWQAGLPTDPDALFERLQADAPDNDRGGIELLVYAADALRSGLITKDVRANIYKALAKVPGLQVTDGQANLGGRIGIALGVDDGDRRQDVIVDPATGQFIGERQVMTDDVDGFKAGTVMQFTSVTTGVVDAIGVKPAG